MVSRAKTATAGATRPPSEAEMAAVLGDMSTAFRALLSRGGERTAEWRRYSKQSPWVLRVSQGKPVFTRGRTRADKITAPWAGGVAAALAGRHRGVWAPFGARRCSRRVGRDLGEDGRKPREAEHRSPVNRVAGSSSLGLIRRPAFVRGGATLPFLCGARARARGANAADGRRWLGPASSTVLFRASVAVLGVPMHCGVAFGWLGRVPLSSYCVCLPAPGPANREGLVGVCKAA